MLDNRNLEKNGCSIIEYFLMMFFSAYYILTSLYSSINFYIIIFVIVIYVCYLLSQEQKYIRLSIIMLSLMIITALAYTILTDTKTIAASGMMLEIKQFISKFFQFLTMYFPVVLFVRMSDVMSERQKRSMITIIGILIVYVMFQTLQELAINPNAIRQWETDAEIEDDNIGGYYFVYSIPILVATILICIEKMDSFKKTIGVLMVVLLFYFLLRAQYTLALLISVIVVLVQLFRMIKNGVFKLIFLFAGVLLLFFLPNLLLWFANNTDSFQMSVRFRELHAFFESGDSGGYNLNSRLTLYSKTIISFFHSPLWGNRNLDFDGHATYLTVLSDTGLIGAIPFYCLLSNAFNSVRETIGRYHKKLIPVFIGLLCMGLTNPIHSSMPLSFAVWFVAPFTIDYIFKKGDAIR